MTVDKSGERIQRMFGEISPRYDFMNHFLSGGTDFYWRWRTVRMAKADLSAPILDVCSGTGDLAMAFRKRLRKLAGKKPAPEVIGSDFTHEMLVIARQKQARAGIPETGAGSLTFLEADTQKLPFADDQFQVVSVAFGLRNVTDTIQGISEMTRVCKPGGKVLILEFSNPTNRLFGSVYRWYFRNILPRLGQLLARNQQSAYNYLPQSVSEFPQGQALASMMESCGLETVTWKPLTFGVATIYCGVKPKTQPTQKSAAARERQPVGAK